MRGREGGGGGAGRAIRVLILTAALGSYLAADELLLLHQRRALCLFLLPLLHAAAQRLDLLHHLGGMPAVGAAK